MQKIILVIAFMLSLSIGFSQELTYSKNHLGNTVAKDKYGNIVAIGSENHLGNIVWKDKFGNVIKTESKDNLGNTVKKDNFGNVETIQSTDNLGNRVEKDYNTLISLDHF